RGEEDHLARRLLGPRHAAALPFRRPTLTGVGPAGIGGSAPEQMPGDPEMSSPAAVVVNHDAGDALKECIASLRAEGVTELVVVDNASSDGSADSLLASEPDVDVVRSPVNLGYGAGANRGLALLRSEFVLVSNPDVAVHQGAVSVLREALQADPALAIVGPRIEEPDGKRYPSARRFPSLVVAAGHAVLAPLAPRNRFTRRYRMEDLDPRVTSEVDWVSGACFMARARALDELRGFDEAYFMYAEDVDLCWRARRAGWAVAYVPGASVTHLQGVSTSKHPFRMEVEHHRSAFRFARRSARGWRRATLPLVGVVLGVRLGAVCAVKAFAQFRGT
ncbi:MAG: glycosyltransferase family 2 protein, partial [Acidimicrobiales bacterium]